MDDEVLGKAYDSRLMRRLLGYLSPHRQSVVVALVAIVGHSVMQLAQPYLMKVVIDQHVLTGNLNGLDRIALLFLIILVTSFALEYVETYTMQMMGQRIMYDLRMQIYRHLQRLDVRFYDRNPVGRLMTRVTTDVDALNDLFAAGVISVFGDLFTLLGIMAILVFMDWRLALVAFSVLPLIAAVTHWFRTYARESYRQVRGWVARINATLQETITGMTTVQLFRQEHRSFERFDNINRSHRDANIDSIFYDATFYPAIEFVGALATALIIWFGGGWTLENTLTLGTLVAFLQYSQRFFRPISDLSEKFNILQSAMASSERVFDLLDTPVEITDPARARAVTGKDNGRIVFDHVWFAYRDEPVLRDVSFSIEPGERVGIVGATGAGKTTLINLLLRFYDVNQGRVTVDGVDVREMSLTTLRRRFGLVLQDVYLFSGTVSRQYRHGADRGHGRRAPQIGSPRARRPRRRAIAEWSRQPGCRARRDAFSRREATPVVCSCVGLRTRRPDSRRGDIKRRHRHRTPHSGWATVPHGRAHDNRDRPPTVDGSGHGPRAGVSSRRAPRVGDPSRAPRATGDLLPALSVAIQGAGADGERAAVRTCSCSGRGVQLFPKVFVSGRNLRLFTVTHKHERGILRHPPDPSEGWLSGKASNRLDASSLAW